MGSSRRTRCPKVFTPGVGALRKCSKASRASVTAPCIALRFRPRTLPLPPEAVMAEGPQAKRLLRLARARIREGEVTAPRTVLRGVQTPNRVVLLGEPHALPWVDGATYLARDPDEPRLYLPTYATLSVPASICADALVTRLGLKAPLVFAGTTVLSVAEATAVRGAP
ncbi:MAG: hypothetical protein AAFY60_03640 [Myxococcota bacterium]